MGSGLWLDALAHSSRVVVDRRVGVLSQPGAGAVNPSNAPVASVIIQRKSFLRAAGLTWTYRVMSKVPRSSSQVNFLPTTRLKPSGSEPRKKLNVVATSPDEHSECPVAVKGPSTALVIETGSA